MIISHKYKFIFVKSGKVAGTSLEMAIRPFLGKDDISTPVADYDEVFAKENGIPKPQNYDYCLGYERRKKMSRSRGIFSEHMWAYEIKGLVGDSVWNEYYTFSIERDPRDKSISTYYHHQNGIKFGMFRNIKNWLALRLPYNKKYLQSSIAKVCSLSRWLKEDKKYAFAENFGRYTINGNIAVDEVYSFQCMNDLVSDLEKRIGCKFNMPRLKSGFRKHRKLTHRESEMLEELLENEIYKKELEIIESN